MSAYRRRIDPEAGAVAVWLGAMATAFALLAVIVDRDMNAESLHPGFAVVAPDTDPVTDTPA
ncbi:hypothetical protein J7W19_16820 [Streptomyces mobaraensis NBRC 13819 = DSM 40847]|uniref:Uncharacterized protein n=1 Tax=Streptomyces mobaraensis (strain ATCC 29032 / DSM 40847 / JCM 4168 / NBRC 13819 / NCIMB 11159 / IPCR 16-22) TaxID=1223523 RepID=M3C941_STRM1|nr:hypothetical protein [Streptomyces mobaraensis]EMF00471.1 hypothetical protein H340_11080 [Streptomyces mobaraensis NBRC 13819 = DSM 40847]QTT74828.1 hypothetical protein J7W19_16820 [Streptomyces mobaraensis NBRC 13819 = DSM 40847]